MKTIAHLVATVGTLLGAAICSAEGNSSGTPDLTVQARATLAQHTGTLVLGGLIEPAKVIRDKWGIPHIYAKSTHDLFFAQGFVAAQDHMWQMELWRRSGEGSLAAVLGPDYVERDKFARAITFRGDWDAEMLKYHPEGPTIFAAFAEGVNAAITLALEEGRVPLEFGLMGFGPEPTWTAKTVLTRMPAWRLSRNASAELARALAVKAMGVDKTRKITVTEPERAWTIPEGLDLADIRPEILNLARKAGDSAWKFKPKPPAAATGPVSELVEKNINAVLASDDSDQPFPGNADLDLGSNNWVLGGSKTTTRMPILANDPHREIANPALRNFVHLVAPGWDVIGMTEPGMPGVSVGHNADVAWGFTILGVDQQDIYVEETDPDDSNRYRYKGEWLSMQVDRQLVQVKGRHTPPVVYECKRTRHGPVLYEDKARHRAYALRWVGDEAGGAGYLGSLNVLQAKGWADFKTGVEKSWYLPSHSLVYADRAGNYGYLAAALCPIRKNWDGLLPVPGKDGNYEWDGFVPLSSLPSELNGGKGYYASANNDVVPILFPKFESPLGYEYSASFRFDRISEVLGENRKFSVTDSERLQGDVLSLPARLLIPLLEGLGSDNPGVQDALKRLRDWDFNLVRDSVAASIYEYWVLEVTPLAYRAHVPKEFSDGFRDYDLRSVVKWLQAPGPELGPDPVAARNRLLLEALGRAVERLSREHGSDEAKWTWGSIHQATFEHPLLGDLTKSLAKISPVSRGGDSFTIQASSSPTEHGAQVMHGASAMMVIDTQDWDRSVALNTPGNESQLGSRHYADLAPLWGNGTYFPLAFSDPKVEEVAEERLQLSPETAFEDTPKSAQFQRTQTKLFSAHRAATVAWGDYDHDGWIDLFVGYQDGMAKLFHNDHGQFVEVSVQAGITDSDSIRSAAWGDFDGDGNLDLYIGFGADSKVPNRLLKGDGKGHFKDVAAKMGVNDWGETRQVCFVDFNNDGRTDLFVAFRDRPNRLYRNDGDHFTEVAKSMGIEGAQKTVGAVWFDYNEDGRLDLFLANQNGSLNRVYRNDGDHFTDVANELGMDGAGRSALLGSVTIAPCDFDGDGRIDLFFANYGPSWLMRNLGGGKFVDVAPTMGVVVNRHLVAAGWGDYDNDGKPDLYACGYLAGEPNIRDYLFHNDGDRFTDITPGYILKHDADHGVAWADYDNDGALDLSLCDHESTGVLSLYHNQLPAAAATRSLQILVLDVKGHYAEAGAEVRIFAAGTRNCLGARLVDSGSGYCAQSAIPVHFGFSRLQHVDVEVTTMSKTGRKVTRVQNVDPSVWKGKALVVKVGPIAD